MTDSELSGDAVTLSHCQSHDVTRRLAAMTENFKFRYISSINEVVHKAIVDVANTVALRWPVDFYVRTTESFL